MSTTSQCDMKELVQVYKNLDNHISELYVVSERLNTISDRRDSHGLPDLQKILPECDRFEDLRLKTKKLLEQYFEIEKTCEIPRIIAYRRFYKELK